MSKEPFAVVIKMGFERYEVWSPSPGDDPRGVYGRHIKRGTFRSWFDAEKFKDAVNASEDR